MLTDREQKLVNRLRTRKVATMRHLQHQFQVCHMTEQPSMKRALEQLRQELRQQREDKNDPDGPLAKIVLKHLDKYWGHLIPDQPLDAGESWQRTTNQLETDWGDLTAKLAEASREAGSFDAWRRQRRPRLLGELPRRLLREEDFIDHLLEIYVHDCHSPATRAA